MSKLIYNSKQNAKYNFFNVFRHNSIKKDLYKMSVSSLQKCMVVIILYNPRLHMKFFRKSEQKIFHLGTHQYKLHIIKLHEVCKKAKHRKKRCFTN